MPTAVFLSPHLDDAAFSAGGTLARLVAEGWAVTLATVFTRSVPDPSGFALACQTDKGLPPGVDYMALRRAEDGAAADHLGVPAGHVLHLDLPEAPHRGYGSAADLFAGVRPDDAGVADDVADVILPWAGADRVYYPLGLGDHVDHLHVIAAAERLTRPGQRWQWLDTPYVLREPPAVRRRGTPEPIAGHLAAKLDACAAYATQLGFQFGGEPTMRAMLAALAGDPPAERFVRPL